VTIAPPRTLPLAAPHPQSTHGDGPLLRPVELADEGREGTGAGSSPVDGFVVDWQLGVSTGAWG